MKSFAVNKLPPKLIDLPPILLTNGTSAVPLKSPVSFNLPFVKASASGVAEKFIEFATNSVVASWVEIVPVAAVGAVGIPVRLGEASGALNNILAVLLETDVGSVAIVLELTPPILLTVAGKEPVPDPDTSPVKVINWSPEFTPPIVTSPITVTVVVVFVPPEIVKPFAKEVGVTPLILLLTNDWGLVKFT